MGEKSYLKEQVYLPGLKSHDLFTEEEHGYYMQMIEAGNQLDILAKQEIQDLAERQKLCLQKKKAKQLMDAAILKHAGTPREVLLESVVYHDKDSSEKPAGVSWDNMKFSRKISEFSSELTRAMGLKHMDHTFDQIVIEWKNIEVLRQIVMDGFYMKILNPDGSVTNKYYRFFTASAGQLRRDKIQVITDEMWDKIKDRMQCGLTWDRINSTKGVNVNKLMAYVALAGSATEEWTDFDIDRCIVIPEFTGTITDRMMYIKEGYKHAEEICTVEIDHTDGAGMMLPSVSKGNFMVRLPFGKGLLSSFDFLQFCKEKNVPAVIKDIWGLEHDLIKENIQILFTESQMKMWKHYSSWQEYKDFFKKCGCKCGRTNYEEDEIYDASLNYQFIQTLTDFTDEEIKEFTKREHDRLVGLSRNQKAMLKALKAKTDSPNPYKAALAYYPEMLREGYTKEQIKATKKRMLLDARSGKVKMRNKRLFAIPDWYAACEYYFQHIEHPQGLLKKGEIACNIYQKYDKADVLRSPSLYCEHSIQKISHDPEVYRWFTTNGVYTSTADLISRILQFDVDGDQLNVVVEPLFVKIAERNLQKFDVIPLFYDAHKAQPEQLSLETMFNGLKRAHDFSNSKDLSIGKISNMLTRLWNKDNPDRLVAAWLTRFNNDVIDG